MICPFVDRDNACPVGMRVECRVRALLKRALWNPNWSVKQVITFALSICK